MIGTLRETSLHAALKQWYARPGDEVEAGVDGYVVDLRRGDTLIEIQTRNFAAIRRKLQALVERHPVRLLHAIASEKVIVRMPPTGAKPLSRRRSPKRGQSAQLFVELVSIPDLIGHPNFSLEVLMTRQEEILRPGGGGSWRRRGWRVDDRRLVEVLGHTAFESPGDFKRFLPPALSEPFTSQDVAGATGLPLYLVQKMTYC
ncbi:MAG TPA: hypothetical protein VKD72_13150, partial [Gemmataceae bacterium]|nr:hypothetical protein [Gemmataceae bacterium]